MAGDEEEANPPEAKYTGAVSIKPAKFNEAAVEGWFRVLEAQMRIANITQSRTKFYHVISALPADVVNNLSTEIMDELTRVR